MADEAVTGEDERAFEEVLDACAPRNLSTIDYETSDGRELTTITKEDPFPHNIHQVLLTKYLETIAEGSSLELYRRFVSFGPFEATLHARYDQSIVVAVARAFKDTMNSCFVSSYDEWERLSQNPDYVHPYRHRPPISDQVCNVVTTATGHVLTFSMVHVGPIVQQIIMVRSLPYIRLIIADVQDAITIQSPVDPYPLRKYLSSPDVPPYAIDFKREGGYEIIPQRIPPAASNCGPTPLSNIATSQLRTYGPEPEVIRRNFSAPKVADDEARVYHFVGGRRDHVSKDMKEMIVKDQGGVCAWCESIFHQIHNPYCIDHRGAVCLGGTSERSNLQALCGTCHRAKTNMDLKCNSLRKKRLKAERAVRVTGGHDMTMRRQQRELLDAYM